nr:reverse transcriptase domain-containing protein [Tanacetum cinerariifolium]
NSTAGGNFLDKMPADCLKIIESKSKVRQARAKADVAKVNSNSSTPVVSSDVAELKDMVRALLLDKKNQYSAQTPSPAPAPIKAVEPNYVTCGGTLPGNTVTNPKEDLKGITTRSGAAYQGPTIPTSSKVAKQGTEVTKDQVTPMPNLKPSIPYPSRRDTERRRDQANKQIEKFYEIFKDMRMDECLALADLGASINLMPLSLWKGLSLPELTPTCMTLELVDRTESKPVGIAKDVKVKVGVFHFPADFVVVDFEPDPRVPLILGRCFLKTSRALIDVHKGKLTLRIKNEAITYNLDQTSRYSANYDLMMANKIDVTDEACEEYSQEVLSFSDVTASGSPTPSNDPIVSTTSPTLAVPLLLEDDPDSPELDPSYYDPEGDIILLEAILNSDPSPPLLNHEQSMPLFKEELKACEAKTIKSSIDEPPEVELKDLPPHREYTFLEGDNKFHVIIAKALRDEEKSALIKVLKSNKRAIAWKLSDIEGNEYYCFLDGFSGYFQIPIDPHDQEKTTFICPYGTFAYRHMPFGLCNASGTFQRFMLAIFHDMVEKTMEVFMDDFSALKKKPTEAPILIAPNWDVPFELMCDASDFAIGVVLGQRHEKHFRPIHYASKTLIDAESNYTTMEKEMLSVVYAFEKFRSYLIMNKCIVHTDHSALKYLFAKKDAKARLLRWVLLLQEFDFAVIDTKGAENLAADHLSQLENSYENVLDPKEINKKFPLKTLSMVTFRGDSSAPWFAHFANYHAGNFLVKAKALPTIDARVVCKFLKSLFARFGAPRAIISDRGTHFCNDQFEKVMRKYGVTHRLSTAYHPQASGQVEEKMKRIHNSKIKNRVFNVGDQVLLFNSRLNIFSGKLKSRWSGPFTIAKVFPYGTVELSQDNGPNFRVNGHRIKYYFGRDVPKLVVPDLQTIPLDQP